MSRGDKRTVSDLIVCAVLLVVGSFIIYILSPPNTSISWNTFKSHCSTAGGHIVELHKETLCLTSDGRFLGNY